MRARSAKAHISWAAETNARESIVPVGKLGGEEGGAKPKTNTGGPK